MEVRIRDKNDFPVYGYIYKGETGEVIIDMPEGKIKNYFEKGFSLFDKNINKTIIVTPVEPEKYLLALMISHISSSTILLVKEERDDSWYAQAVDWMRAGI